MKSLLQHLMESSRTQRTEEYDPYHLNDITIQMIYRKARENSNRYKPYFKDKNLYDLFDNKLYSFGELFSDKTGARGRHHNFLGGLFVHTFEMLDILWETYVKHPERCEEFLSQNKKRELKKSGEKFDPETVDFGIAATAILYHDWGKLEEYDHEAGPDEKGMYGIAYGMLSHGHIVLSFSEFRQDAKKWHVTPFIAEKVEHCILAHHSKLDWGSPVKPITIEAHLVCNCDLISSKQASGKSNYFYDFLNGNVKIGDEKELYDEKIKPWMDSERMVDNMHKSERKVRDRLRDMSYRNKEDMENNYGNA